MYAAFAFFVLGLVVMCLIYNYTEEKVCRSSLLAVVLWALSHLIMGIPIWAVIPIFSVGLVYKAIYDRWGLDHAYCAHFFTNMTLVGVIVVSIVLLD
jgi:hypothetical protein